MVQLLKWMCSIDTYYYKGILYTWHHESQHLYHVRHISIYSAIIAIENGILSEVLTVHNQKRYKHISLSTAGIITVITEEMSICIIAAWHSSTAEIKNG